MLFTVLVGGLPLVAGMATGAVQHRASPSVLVSLFHDKTTNENSIIVTDEARAKTYGHSCAATLALGSLNITYDVDQYGSGTLQFGSKTYTVHSDPAVSGGVECGTIYDDTELHVECVAPWPAGTELVELPAAATDSCFDDHLTRRAAFGLDRDSRGMQSGELVSRGAEPRGPGGHARRQAGSGGTFNCNPTETSRLVGNGNPHQNYHHIQLSQNAECKTASQCSAGYEQSKSYSIGWSATAGVPWISGGFAVQTSWTTGNNYECQAGKNQIVCIKYRTAMTAYTVQKGWRFSCTAQTQWESQNIIIWSPNKNNKGGAYYCATGSACTSQGDWKLVKEGRAGGP